MNLEDYGIVKDEQPSEYIHEDDYLTYEQIKAREEKQSELKEDQLKENRIQEDIDTLNKAYKAMSMAGTAHVQDAAELGLKVPQEIDYTKLKPGMRVKIKSWARMVKEYGKEEGRIYPPDFGCSFSEKKDKYLCGKIIEIDFTNGNLFETKEHGWSLPYQCIESIITEEPDLSTYVPKSKDGYIVDTSQPTPSLFTKLVPYAQPKQVKAIWLGQTEGDVEIESFTEMVAMIDYLGFIPEEKHGSKYMVQTDHEQIGIAVNGYSQWDSCGAQGENRGIYYIFPTARDLYLWMAEGKE